MNILEEICLHQQQLVDQLKVSKPVSILEKSEHFGRTVSSLKKKYEDGKTGIIAEFKRRSPSKPAINPDAVSTTIVPGYANAGAFASSILTNTKYFGGRDEDLTSVRVLTDLPLLRKEFIVDEYQVYETKAIGADLILLIAAALPVAKVLELSKLAKQVGLEILLELKDENELDYINPYVDFVGVNNRDLRTFTVDVGMSERLSQLIPDDFVKVSESGLSKPETIKHLENYGFRSFLMGEHFMVQTDPVKECANFIGSIQA
ncbi:MAG: indole-3-glycerol phosphate synthase TrpC [Bacteroidota bacterium]